MSSYIESLEDFFKYKNQLIMNKKHESKNFYTETDKEFKLNLNNTNIRIQKRKYLVLIDEINRLKLEANALKQDILSKQKMFLSIFNSKSISNSIQSDIEEIAKLTKHIEDLSNIKTSDFIEITSTGEYLIKSNDLDTDHVNSDDDQTDDELQSLNSSVTTSDIEDSDIEDTSFTSMNEKEINANYNKQSDDNENIKTISINTINSENNESDYEDDKEDDQEDDKEDDQEDDQEDDNEADKEADKEDDTEINNTTDKNDVKNNIKDVNTNDEKYIESSIEFKNDNEEKTSNDDTLKTITLNV